MSDTTGDGMVPLRPPTVVLTLRFLVDMKDVILTGLRESYSTAPRRKLLSDFADEHASKEVTRDELVAMYEEALVTPLNGSKGMGVTAWSVVMKVVEKAFDNERQTLDEDASNRKMVTRSAAMGGVPAAPVNVPVGAAAVVAAAAPLFMTPTPLDPELPGDGKDGQHADIVEDSDGDPPQDNVIVADDDDENMLTPQPKVKKTGPLLQEAREDKSPLSKLSSLTVTPSKTTGDTARSLWSDGRTPRKSGSSVRWADQMHKEDEVGSRLTNADCCTMVEWKQFLDLHRPTNVHPHTFDGAARFLARVQHFSPGLVELDGGLFVNEAGFTPMFKKAIAQSGLPETPYLLEVATTKALLYAGKKSQLNETQAFVSTDAAASAPVAPRARVRRPPPGPFVTPRVKRMRTVEKAPSPFASSEEINPVRPTTMANDQPDGGNESSSSDDIIFLQETRAAVRNKGVPVKVEGIDVVDGTDSNASLDESDGSILDFELTSSEEGDDENTGVQVDPVTGRVAVFQSQTGASSAPGPVPLELQIEARKEEAPVLRPLPVLHGGGRRLNALSDDAVDDFLAAAEIQRPPVLGALRPLTLPPITIAIQGRLAAWRCPRRPRSWLPPSP